MKMKFAVVSINLLIQILISSQPVRGLNPIQLKPKPNIILIMADDLGFNDVSFHGSNQIPTPNIDALAYSGIILNNYYVSPICTPTRAALLTGIYPIHLGLQHNVIFGTTPFGLPLQYKLIPEYLKDFGYSTHLIGKWHLGHFKRKYTPTCRGFDSFYGHWTGHKDYYDNTAQEQNPQAWGYDMRRNFEVSYENFGKYTTDLFTDEAIKIIQAHNQTIPLFLMVSQTAVHSANPHALLQAPIETVNKFNYIKDPERRKFAAMVSKMDDSVGLIVDALAETNLLSNSIIIFSTDNGGPAAGFNGNAASNWPLRGVKNTLWEGGVRGVGLIWSPLLKQTSGTVSNALMHVTDWLPTLINAIGEDPNLILSNNVTILDGLNLWPTLISGGSESPRNEILHNIDDIYGNEAVRYGKWKLLYGTTYNGSWDNWYGPSGRHNVVTETETESTSDDDELIFQAILSSQVSKSLQQINHTKFLNKTHFTNHLRSAAAQIQCNNINKTATNCSLINGDYCLYNIIDDPCEYNNLANNTTCLDILKLLQEVIVKYRRSAVSPINKPKDLRGQPKFWNYTWTNWMDFIEHDDENGTQINNGRQQPAEC